MVGFDLDMTLIDARAGVIRVLHALVAEFDVGIDVERYASNLGPPLETMLRDQGFDDPWVVRLAGRFRELYPELAVAAASPMPGAERALRELRAGGVRTLVVTGKHEPNARRHVEALGWEIDVRGDVFGAAKGEVLSEEGASVYVGDHVGDIAGAKAAGATAVAVATGPCGAEDLRAAGADVVLGDLTEFPAWFAAECAPRS